MHMLKNRVAKTPL